MSQRGTAFLGSYSSDGVRVAEVDQRHGTLTVGTRVSGVPDASWLAFSTDRRFLYCTNETDQDGTVTALRLTGDPPTVLNRQPTLGAAPTHLSVHPSGRFLLTANCSAGSVVVHPLLPDGRIDAPSDLVRQSPAPHGVPLAHQIVTDPSGRWVLSVNLGNDSVFVYRLDLDTGKLAAHQRVSVAAGTGPRHLVFHPAHRHGYLVAENRSEVLVVDWDAEKGELTPGQVVGTVESGAVSPNYPAEAVLSADGRFLYVTNRGDNSLATFAVGDGGADLRLLGTTPIGGDWPRQLALDSTESWCYVANQRSGTVTWLPRDRATGRPGPVTGSVAVPAVAMVLLG